MGAVPGAVPAPAGVRVPRRAAPHVWQRHGAKPPPQLTPSLCTIRLFSSVCYNNSPLSTPSVRRWGRARSRSSNDPRLSRTAQLFGHIPGAAVPTQGPSSPLWGPVPVPPLPLSACVPRTRDRTPHGGAGGQQSAGTAPVPRPAERRYRSGIPPSPPSRPAQHRYRPGTTASPPIPTSRAPVPPRYLTQPPIPASPAPVLCRSTGHQPRPPRPAQRRYRAVSPVRPPATPPAPPLFTFRALRRLRPAPHAAPEHGSLGLCKRHRRRPPPLPSPFLPPHPKKKKSPGAKLQNFSEPWMAFVLPPPHLGQICRTRTVDK